MAYFNQLPKTQFLNQTIVNLAVGVKLNKLINQSKIALNFTEQDNTKYNYNPLSNFKYHFPISSVVHEILEKYSYNTVH